MSSRRIRSIGFHQFMFRCAVLLALLSASLSASVVAQDNKDDAATQAYNAIGALQNGGLYSRAAVRWKEFITKYPNDKRIGDIQYYLGLCQLHTKKYAESAAAFRVVLAKYKTSKFAAGAQYNLGMALFQTASVSNKPDEFKTAAAEFAKVGTSFAQSKFVARALYFQGEALYSAADVTGAIGAYQKLIATHASDPLVPDTYYALGSTQQENGDHAAAAKTFEAFLANQSLAQHALAGEIRLRLGMALYSEEKFTDAEKHFDMVAKIAQFPHADFAMLRQAQCRMATDKHSAALPLLDALLGQFAESQYRSSALVAKGKCHFTAKQYDPARPPLEEVAKSSTPEAAEATFWLGQCWLDAKKPAEALAVLEPAVAKFKEGDFAVYLQKSRIDALYELPDRRKETVPMYDAFAKQFTDHELTPHAVYMAALVSLENDDQLKSRQYANSFLGNAQFVEHPLRPAVLFVAAESHVLAPESDASADLAQAQQLYQELVAKFPEHERASRSYVRIGWCQYQAKQYDQAVQSLSGAVAKLKDPSHTAEAHLLIGRSHTSSGRDKEAVAAYEASLKAKEDWKRVDEVLIAQAASFRTLKDLNSARDRLNRLVAQHKTSAFVAQATYQLGEIAQEQKNDKEAIARFGEVWSKFADSPFAAPAAYGQGVSYFNSKDFPNATKSLTELLTKFADAELAVNARYLRGLCYERQKQFDPAIEDLQAFLAAKPKGGEAPDAAYTLAICQVGLKQYEPAVASLGALVAQHPDYKGTDKVYYELGHALKKSDKLAESIKAFETLVAKKPDSSYVAESWFHVGDYYEGLAVKEQDEAAQAAVVAKAIDAYKQGAAKATDAVLHEKLQYKLGNALFKSDKLAEALPVLQAQIQKHPSGDLIAPAWFLTAECFFRQNAFDQALPLYVQVINKKVAENRAQSLYRAGASAGNLKNWPVSQQYYTLLIGEFPKFALIEDAQYGLAWSLKNQTKISEVRQICTALNGKKSEAAAKARFLLGEIDFTEKKYEDAIEHFLFITVNFGYKEQQALAYFETGRCFIELDQSAEAIKTLTTFVEKFPDHSRAKNAIALIEELKK